MCFDLKVMVEGLPAFYGIFLVVLQYQHGSIPALVSFKRLHCVETFLCRTAKMMGRA